MDNTDLARAIGALEGRLTSVAELMATQNELTLQSMKEAREDRHHLAGKLDDQGATLAEVAGRVDGLDRRVANIEPVANRVRHLEKVGAGVALTIGALASAMFAALTLAKGWLAARFGF